MGFRKNLNDIESNDELRRKVPHEWSARQVTIGDETEIVTGPMKEVGSHRELLEQFGYDPAEVEISGTVNQWRKQLPNGEWVTSYFFKVLPKEMRLDLPALYAAARRKPLKKASAGDGLAIVVVLADVQAGKTARRGGTPELIERLRETRARLDEYLKDAKPSRLILAEAGDLFEGFESGGNPMFTNDLSLSQQMDLAGTEVLEFVRLMEKYGRVDVVCVPSNHTAWRRGKQNLGKPGDDLGLFVHKQVSKIAEAAGLDAHWTFPGHDEESVSIDVDGTIVGMVHGNQFNPGGAVNWWAGQQHGGQPIAQADILVTGHYHHLSVLPTGHNAYTGRSKWWLQAPTLDNGSDWYRHRAGDDSDPGLLVFGIGEHGFDLQSLTVL